MTRVLPTILFSAMVGMAAFALAGALAQRHRRPDQVGALVVLLTALGAHALGGLVIAAGLYRFAPHLAGMELPLRMALGPALYFYVRSMVSPEPTRFGGRDWTALLGPALVVVLCLPFMMLSADEKLALADPRTRDPVHFRLAVFACTAGVLTFLAFTAAYIVASFRLQARHRAAVIREYANIEARSLDWLRVMLVVWSVAWLFFGVKYLLGFAGLSSAPLGTALAAVETLALAAFAHLALHQPQAVEDAASAGEKKAPDLARAAILTEERMARVAARLTSTLGTDRFYTDGDLSLRRLSEVTGITRHHISETLSQHLKTNFFDFVNAHRVEEAKRMLAETDSTVLDVAMEVGFNARSTFNAAFKKHAGMTPSAYRRTAKVPRAAVPSSATSE